jgi:HK97 gp10 family phage protein
VRIAVTTPPDLDFSALEAEARAAVDQALKAGVQMIANDAKRAVASGPKTGNIYTHYFRTGPNGGVFPVEKRGVPHQASAPGEAPATDTGRLVNSIVADAEWTGDSITGYVRADVEYARWLEYGTRKILPRPFLIPAIERNRQRIVDLIRVAFATAAGQFARKVRR